MEIRKLENNQIDEIKTLFKNVFMNEPWNDIFLQTERELPAYSFYQKLGFKELEGHASLVKRFD